MFASWNALPLAVICVALCATPTHADGDDVYSCGGFLKSSVPISFDNILVKLHTLEGNLKYETDVAPNNGRRGRRAGYYEYCYAHYMTHTAVSCKLVAGYYMIPVYAKGSYVIRVHPPHGWKFGRSRQYIGFIITPRAGPLRLESRRLDRSVRERCGH
jgi:hypothetical protein